MVLTLRPVRILLLVVLAIIGISLTRLSHIFSIPSLSWSDVLSTDSPTSHIPHELRDAKVSLHDVIHQVAAIIASAATRYDPDEGLREYGIKLGHLDPARYQADIRSTYSDFFANSTQTDLLSRALSYLSLIQPPTDPLPKTVYTTDLAPISRLPNQFHSWAEMNPDWKTMFVDDGSMDEWLGSSFTGDGGVVREMKALAEKHGIVRADIFRYVVSFDSTASADHLSYLVLLLHGGVYTDSDTACVRPIQDWGQNPDHPSLHPLLTSLPHLVRLADQSTHSPPPDDGPSLLVAVEIDAQQQEMDWRGDGLHRGLEMVQWTILAKPGHPVLMDVLGRALRGSREVRESVEAGEDVVIPNVVGV